MTTRKPVVVSAPNGRPIVGHSRSVPADAELPRAGAGVTGRWTSSTAGSDMFFEEQRIVTRKKERVFLNERGNEWRESQLIVIEAEGFAAWKGGN